MSIKWRYMFLLAAVFAFSINLYAQVQLQSKDQPVPLAYGLVIDNSASLRSQIEEVIEAGKSIVNSHKPDDRTFLVRFVDSEKIKTLQDFTSNKKAINDALDTMYVEWGRSAIIDAVYFSAQHISRHSEATDAASKRSLILITDGDERTNYYKLETLIKLLQEKNVRVYVIGITEELKQEGKRTHEKAVKLLIKLAEESGGRAYFPETMSEVKRIAGGILDDVRKQ